MKKATHIFAWGLAAVAAFMVTPAGQALVHQYPIVSGISGVILALAAVYHEPKTQN